MSSTHHTISVGVYSHLLDAFPSILLFLLIYSRSRIITTYWYGLDAVLPYYMEIDTTYVMVVNCTMGMDVSSRGLTLTTSVSSSMQAILDLLNLVTTVWGKHRAALPKHWPWWSRWGHFDTVEKVIGKQNYAAMNSIQTGLHFCNISSLIFSAQGTTLLQSCHKPSGAAWLCNVRPWRKWSLIPLQQYFPSMW